MNSNQKMYKIRSDAGYALLVKAFAFCNLT